MDMSRLFVIFHLFIFAILSSVFNACTYDPPPAIESSVPEDAGIMDDDGGITVVFTESVDRSTLRVILYRSQTLYNAEGELFPECSETRSDNCLEKLIGPCTPGRRCDGARMTLDQKTTRLGVTPAEKLPVGQYVLRMATGLADLKGNDTGVPLDLTFSTSPCGEDGPTTFESGVLLTWLDLTEPLSYPLELYWILEVNQATGQITGTACDSDPDGVDHVNHDQEKWYPWPYTYKNGYSFEFTGRVCDTVIEDGNGGEKNGYYLETNPFRLYAGPPVEVEVANGTIGVAIIYDDELGRYEANGVIRSPETYILSSSESGGESQVASGVLYGYSLTQDEIDSLNTEFAEEWRVCHYPEDANSQ